MLAIETWVSDRLIIIRWGVAPWWVKTIDRFTSPCGWTKVP